MRAERTDDELLARHVRGDVEAFVTFYRRHLPTVIGYFLRRTGDREVAADLTAETFAAALLAARRYRPGDAPALAWLYGIASHKLADSLRRGQVEGRARRRLAMEPLAFDDEDLVRVDDLAEVDGGRALMRAAVATLPEEQRQAVQARVVDERDYDEIATEMECSEMVVRQRVSRGLKALREQIKEMS